MKLLHLELFGEYKGLKNQGFDFSSIPGDVAVLIGANGSGKSQLLELIAEVFAYLERWQRRDFRVRGSLGYDFKVTYEIKSFRFIGVRRFVIDSRNGVHGDAYARAGPSNEPNQEEPAHERWERLPFTNDLLEVLLPRLIGYASGLSENLQRPFMRNTLQFHDVIQVRSRLRAHLAQPGVDEAKTITINNEFLGKYPGIYAPESDLLESENFRLREADTPTPKSLFLDYDCASLLVASLGFLGTHERDAIWNEIPFRHPVRAVLRFDLRSQATATDNARDIQLLIELAGPGKLTPLSIKTTEEQYDLLKLDYLAGEVELDFTDHGFRARMENSSRDPSQWFFALYKLQLLGAGKWAGNVTRPLRRDNFQGHVRKPLKGKLPLAVQELWMSDGNTEVSIDDLSDGETQLLHTLGAVRLFGDDETLFLFDEPETHLNPSWRTRFHLDFKKSNSSLGSAQAFISSHSPFLVSSLPREAVFFFEKVDGASQMDNPTSETFGASFDVLIKKHFGLRATISETAILEIRERLADDSQSNEQKIGWLQTKVGDSMERSYLIEKLRAE